MSSPERMMESPLRQAYERPLKVRQRSRCPVYLDALGGAVGGEGVCMGRAEDLRRSNWAATIDVDEGNFILSGESENDPPIHFCPWCGGKLVLADVIEARKVRV